MQVKIHELAAKEFDDAIEWYELQSNNLGSRFKNAILNQIANASLPSQIKNDLPRGCLGA